MQVRGRFVLVRVGGRLYAVEAVGLLGMVSASGARLQKNESGYWVDVEGANVPVVAPHRELEGCEPLTGTRSCVLLFGVADGRRTGILVDSVSRIEAMEERRVRRGECGPLQAKVLVGDKWIGVLDVGRITGED